MQIREQTATINIGHMEITYYVLFHVKEIFYMKNIVLSADSGRIVYSALYEITDNLEQHIV